MATATPKLKVGDIDRLAFYFERNGYVRKQNEKRLKKEGYSAYKKGDEIRLIAETKKELAEIRRLLVATGFKPGKPFEKAQKIGQPLYGRDQVAMFLKLLRQRKRATK